MKEDLCKDYKLLCNEIIEKNIIHHNNKSIFTAGQSIYYALCTRDFLYSVPILMKDPIYIKPIKDTIELILSKKTKNNLLPRVIDTMNFEWRIFRSSIRSFFNLKPEQISHKGSWKPIYKNHGGVSDAIDTNLLMVNAVLELCVNNLLSIEIVHVASLLNYYADLIDKNTGLIVQKSFSDWKDSISRKGIAFLTNILYWKVLKMIYSLETDNLESIKSLLRDEISTPEKISKTIHQIFYKDSVYYSIYVNKNIQKNYQGIEYYGVDENLLAIEWSFVTGEDAVSLFRGILEKTSNKVDKTFFGPPVSPEYPWFQKSTFMKPNHVYYAGIQGYHDRYIWSWVTALAAKTAFELGFIKEGRKLFEKIKIIIERDQTVYNSYCFENDGSSKEGTIVQVKTRAFRSEHDWLWGSVYVLDMLNYFEVSNIIVNV